MMKNCKYTETFFDEFDRMCSYYLDDETDGTCEDCPLHGGTYSCIEFIVSQARSAVEIVQEWSDKHPKKENYLVQMVRWG